jgi:hypothetical protein
VVEEKATQGKDLTPRQIVTELDRYIVGQNDAKRAVAIAIRNRWRRQQLPDELRQEVSPKNILMIGPTGVGKTEIARRLAKLTGAPFIKVEATKYTEVGYYGRDVESIVRELVDSSLSLVRQKEKAQVEDDARIAVAERLIDMILQKSRESGEDQEPLDVGREELERRLAAGELEDSKVEIVVETRATPIMVGGVGMEHMDIDLQGMFEKILPKQTNRRELTVAQARKILFEQECDARLDQDSRQIAVVVGQHLPQLAQRGGHSGTGRDASDDLRPARSRALPVVCSLRPEFGPKPIQFAWPWPRPQGWTRGWWLAEFILATIEAAPPLDPRDGPRDGSRTDSGCPRRSRASSRAARDRTPRSPCSSRPRTRCDRARRSSTRSRARSSPPSTSTRHASRAAPATARSERALASPVRLGPRLADPRRRS